MNALSIAVILCLAVFASCYEDGSWKGEGLAESQDHGQWDDGKWDGAWGGPKWDGAWAGPWGVAPYAGKWAWAGHGAAPIGHDGRVVDTPEVAAAKAAHFAAVAAASHGPAPWGPAPWGPAPWGPAPWKGAPWVGVALTPDGKYLKDTPEVAHAKAQHFAAKAAAAHPW